MTLASIILDMGKRVFRHPDRSQAKRERSEGYIEWSQNTLNLTKNFQGFIGEQVQQDNELRANAADITIGVSNMFLSYVDEARSEYAYLNVAFKCIVMLVPNCEDNRPIRLETQSAIRIICDGIIGSFHDIYSTCSQNQHLSENYVSRRWTLAKFYIAHLRSLATPLFKDICSSGSDSAACRSIIRYVLFFMRSRFISSEAIKRNHPAIQSEIAKFVNAVEDIIVSALFGSEKASDDEKHALIHEFALASGPRTAFDITDPLLDYEWDVGRLKFLLKITSIFDEFSPALQLRLYPVHGGAPLGSILLIIVDCVNSIGVREFGPLTIDTVGQENGDLYFRILSDLCTFAFLLQPKQFTTMQIDMIGLALAKSELWSLIAEDWWTCISDKLGQEFTSIQVEVLMELLISLPTGNVSQRIGGLIACMTPLLDEQSQLVLTRNLLTIFDHKSHQNIQTLLVDFPYECLSGTNLDLLVNRCMDGWRDACDLLRDERLVLEAFYTMHQYVACLASIFSKRECHLIMSDDIKVSLVDWSVEIIGGAHELLLLIQDDVKSLSKISRTIEDLVEFLQSMQPLQYPRLIHVLDTIVSWESLPIEKRPLSRISIAKFLSSCSTMEISEESDMSKLCTNTPHIRLAEGCIPDSSRNTVRKMVEQGKEGNSIVAEDTPMFWAMMGEKAKFSQSQRFNNGTISDLQAISEMRPSPQACISALAILARYLETSDGDGHNDNMVRQLLTSELTKIQRLSQAHKESLQQNK
ncbi:hypothetical protein BGX27_002168 [Mortierella sp. AM989]|nr:hypothetical protein BGX27_002168 [Mortierella sp. AM989]